MLQPDTFNKATQVHMYYGSSLLQDIYSALSAIISIVEIVLLSATPLNFKEMRTPPPPCENPSTTPSVEVGNFLLWERCI